MNKSEISYQNKDIVSKVFADRFKGKTLEVYGVNVPRVVDVLPTNLPDFAANELKIDNLFLLEDGSVAIIDYESEFKPVNKNKYLNYIARVVKRYENEGVYDVKVRMIVIYTGDVLRDEVKDFHDIGAVKLQIESGFLSEIDSEEVRLRLKGKIENDMPLTDEEMMEFIIWPLTYKGDEQKKRAIKEAVELVKRIKDETTAVFVLSGVIVFGNKIIDEEIIDNAGRWIGMTKLGQWFEDQKQEALRELSEKKDAEIAAKDSAIAAKDARIKELEEMLAAKK